MIANLEARIQESEGRGQRVKSQKSEVGDQRSEDRRSSKLMAQSSKERQNIIANFGFRIADLKARRQEAGGLKLICIDNCFHCSFNFS